MSGARAADPGRRRRQRLDARRRLRRRRRQAARRARAAAGRDRVRLRHRRARPRLRGDARLRRARARRRQPPGRRAGDALRDGARPDRDRATIEDGEVVNPHGDGPEDRAAVRQDGGRLARARCVVVACEPAEVEEMGLGLSPEVAEAVERAVELVARDGRASCAPTPRTREPEHARALDLERDRRHGLRHADGRRVTRGRTCGSARLRQVVPESLEFYFEIVSRDTACEGARLELESWRRVLRCADCAHEWDPTAAVAGTVRAVPFSARVRAARLEVGPRRASSRWSRSRSRSAEAACTAPR